VGPLIEKKRHTLTLSVAPGQLPVFADPTRMEQVLVNLLTNAAKYTEEGGHITLTARRDGEVIVTVKDNGVGIAPEMLPRIFDLFAQVDRTIDRSQGGLGIGLTLARSLVEMHGGHVWAASDGPGRGSEFIISLPVAGEEGAAEPRTERKPQGPARKGLRILVVDDNHDTAIGMAKLLAGSGYEVMTAHDGHSAVERARAERPDAILMDIGLPGIDGYEVARQLRKEGCCTGATLIAVSGYGQEEDRRRSREAGFDHHFVKPVDYDTLFALLAGPGPIFPLPPDERAAR
jgi:CheY-like chemotaxis protein